jgi:hydrogenase maturation protease
MKESRKVEHRILVACIGNIFLGDDAFGVEVARRLAGRPLPEGVRVVDFGIRSYDLAYALTEDWELVILVDAVRRGGTPGAIYLIEPELPGADASTPPAQIVDAHSMNPAAVLRLVVLLGGAARRMILVGCEPSPDDPEEAGMELSPPVQGAVQEAVRVIEELIAKVSAAPAVGTIRN